MFCKKMKSQKCFDRFNRFRIRPNLPQCRRLLFSVLFILECLSFTLIRLIFSLHLSWLRDSKRARLFILSHCQLPIFLIQIHILSLSPLLVTTIFAYSFIHSFYFSADYLPFLTFPTRILQINHTQTHYWQLFSRASQSLTETSCCLFLKLIPTHRPLHTFQVDTRYQW